MKLEYCSEARESIDLFTCYEFAPQIPKSTKIRNSLKNFMNEAFKNESIQIGIEAQKNFDSNYFITVTATCDVLGTVNLFSKEYESFTEFIKEYEAQKALYDKIDPEDVFGKIVESIVEANKEEESKPDTKETEEAKE